MLETTTPAQARDVAERLRTAVERLDFSTIAPALRATISLGVHLPNGTDSGAAIAAADTLLYRAKEGGRNRVEMEGAATGMTGVRSGGGVVTKGDLNVE